MITARFGPFGGGDVLLIGEGQGLRLMVMASRSCAFTSHFD